MHKRTVRESATTPMRLLLFIILILVLIAALPTWPYSTGWGYYPSGGLGGNFVNRVACCLTSLGQTAADAAVCRSQEALFELS